MKKIILSVIIAALLVTALAGCGSRNDEPEATMTPGTNNGSTVKPEDNNGVVQDENGVIGDKDTAQNGVLPEIGGEIEQGANDIIDGVGDAVNGNDNNGGNVSANEENSDNAGSGSRMRGRKTMN
ncbi:MAG: hypothetical protein E7420_08905 [Ruminococcaceae bacterium]|nr:hypothetical protein [Oscillospiraceae bacterium]